MRRGMARAPRWRVAILDDHERSPPALGGARSRARPRHRALHGEPPAPADARRTEGHRAREGHTHGALGTYRRRGVPPPAPRRDGQPEADGGDREGAARVGVSHARRARGISRPVATGRANSPIFLPGCSVQALQPGPVEWTTMSLVSVAGAPRGR